MTVVVQRIEGLQQLEAALKELREQFGVRTGGIIIRGMRKGMRLIRDEARRRAPQVPSGFTPTTLRKGRGKRARSIAATAGGRRSLLSSSIVEHAIPSSSRLAGGRPTVIVRVRNSGYTRTSSGAIRFNRPGTTAGWWWWLEFGTSRRAAQPFIRPAFEAQKLAAIEAMKASVRAEIEEFWKQNMFRRAA